MAREFLTVQCVGAHVLAEQLNKLQKTGWNIFQVLYAIDLSEVGTSHSYTIIYFRERRDAS